MFLARSDHLVAKGLESVDSEPMHEPFPHTRAHCPISRLLVQAEPSNPGSVDGIAEEAGGQMDNVEERPHAEA